MISDQRQCGTATEDELLGVTRELIDFIKTFTVDTFKDFQFRGDDDHDDGNATSPPGHVRTDLSHWQARHAKLVLSKVKEMSNLRYTLCPRHLKEHMFWKIYFRLVQCFVNKYEEHAIRLERIKKNSLEKDRAPKNNGFEVEMAEIKTECSSSSSISMDQP
uniref:BSD domain-containing protein n=1 Tax=Kalanchoe fedtschenkoi TaxID=63787 RepID=A0A7N0UWD5_KALFE